MFAVEAFMSEFAGECSDKNGLPPGFRFHPTDEELITFYLASKVFNGSYSGVEIPDLDLNNYEPWELPDAAKVGEVWYFYNLKDRKYPTGLRTNRATGTGYWKSTGKDREVLGSSTGCLLGMKKTLVYYKGRAPTGTKTRWIMHEYRLDGDISCRRISKEEWVICRISHKTGEKKSPYLKGQGYHLEGFPSLLNTNCSLQALQNQEPFLVLNQQKDYTKSLLMNPVSSPSHLFSLDGCLQPTFPPNSVSVGTFATSKATDNTCKKEPTSTTSQLLKSILSHQAYNTPNEPVRTVSKKCKIETNSSHLQLQYDVADKSHPFSGVDLRSSEAASFSASTADNMLAFNGLPASIDQNRGGCLQTMVDSQIIFPGESWPLNP